MTSPSIIHVAVPSPLNRHFDYLIPPGMAFPRPGARVRVPFANKSLVGIVVSFSNSTHVAKDKLRDIDQVIDDVPLFESDLLKLLQWASRYYVHPIGEVLTAALPVLLRGGVPVKCRTYKIYKLKKPDSAKEQLLKKAKVQLLIYQAMFQNQQGLDSGYLKQLSPGWRGAVKSMISKGIVEVVEEINILPRNTPDRKVPDLLSEQCDAVNRVKSFHNTFQTFLLNGITGSGKTEVYLNLIDWYVSIGGQVLVMVPEISLTPQLLERFRQRLSCSFVALHSQISAGVRASNWVSAAKGDADVVIGTRSSVFTPMPRLNLIIIDEEHDNSLKQQDGFRYHARDLAIIRARDRKIPIVLGSATPALESIYNVNRGKYTELPLRRRAGNAVPPVIGLLDIRRRKTTEGISELLLKEIEKNYNAGSQSLIFINRRGFSPVLICADCGATSDCNRCDSHMTVHAKTNCLRCHHCGAQRPVPHFCTSCGSIEFDNVGHGSERIEAALEHHFPGANIVRIDRDTTRRKGELERYLSMATNGEADILVGTQMLAKGHHFPNVTLVGILDTDRGLFGTDFRAIEQTGQLITQVAGRAGRAERAGRVLVQTRNPEHELLRLLISGSYNEFANSVLTDRRESELPPYSFVALIRAESPHQNQPPNLLSHVVATVKSWGYANGREGVWLFGPVVAPMERLGGRYRYQLMLQAGDRRHLNNLLFKVRNYLEENKYARKVRWSIDVDPVDLY